MQTTQVFEYHNGISRTLNKYTAAFTESCKAGLCKAVGCLCWMKAVHISGWTISLPLKRQDSEVFFLCLDLQEPLHIPHLFHLWIGSEPDLSFQAPAIETKVSKCKWLAYYKWQKGMLALRSISYYRLLFNFFPDLLQYDLDGWPCRKSSVFFLLSLSPSPDVTALPSLTLTKRSHTVMQYSPYGTSLPERQKRFTDQEKAVPAFCLSHLVSFHCACVSWGHSQFVLYTIMWRKGDSCTFMRLCTTLINFRLLPRAVWTLTHRGPTALFQNTTGTQRPPCPANGDLFPVEGHISHQPHAESKLT